MQLSTKKAPPRKEALDSLIDEILELNEAKRFDIDVSGLGRGQFVRQCREPYGSRHAEADAIACQRRRERSDTLKRRLKAQIAWTNLVRGRYKASLEIPDKDVEAELQLHKPERKN